MPRLSAEGQNVFSLSGTREGSVQTRYDVEAGLEYGAQIKGCHGLRVSAGGNAFARARGRASRGLAVLEAEARANLGAGAEIDVRLSPNVLDGFGLTAVVQAYAEAAIAARLDVGLRTETLVERAEEQIGPGVGAELFAALARRLTVNAGVWGKASFAASASAHLLARGRLFGEDAGFEIGLGAGAAVKAGAGFEFYGRVGFDDQLGEFFDEAAGLLADAFVDAVADALGADGDRPALGALGVVTRIALRTGFELGHEVARGDASPADLADRLTRLTSAELQRYVLAVVLEAGTEALAEASDDPAARELAEQTARAASPPDDPDALFRALLDVAAEADPEAADALALTWCALVAASGDRSVELPDAPAPVFDRVRDVLPGSVPRLSRETALLYLGAAGAVEVLRRHRPDDAAVLDRAAEALGGDSDSALDAVGLVLRLASDPGGTATEELYPSLSRFLADEIEALLADDLLGRVRRGLDSDDPRRIYLDEVVEPALRAVPRVLLVRLDALVAGTAPAEAERELRGLLGVLAYRLVAGNVVVLSQVLLDHVLDETHAGFLALQREIERGRLDRLYTAGWRALPPAVTETLPAPPAREAVRQLAADLAAAGAEAAGPQIWTRRRREEIHEATRALLYSFSFHDVEDLEAHAGRLADCRFIPDVEGLEGMQRTMAGIVNDEVDLILREVVPAWVRFYAAVAAEGLEAFVEAARRAVEEALEILRREERRLETLRTEAERARRELERARRDAERLLRELDDLFDDLVDDVVDAVRRAAARRVPDLRPAQGVFDRFFDRKAKGPLRRLAGRVSTRDLDVAGLVRRSVDRGQDPVAAVRSRLRTRVRGWARDLGVPLPLRIKVLRRSYTLLKADPLVDRVVDALLPATAQRSIRSLATARKREVRLDNALSGARRRVGTLERRVQTLAQETADLYVTGPRGQLSIEIESPGGTAEGEAVRGPTVPVHVVVRGGRRSFVGSPLGRPALGRRVEVLINGTVVRVDPDLWQYDGRRRRLVLETAIPAAQARTVPGLNVLEVRATDGRPGRPRRASAQVVFLVQSPRVTVGRVGRLRDGRRRRRDLLRRR
jgi:hypothetical protein